jgi:hypothetical protein
MARAMRKKVAAIRKTSFFRFLHLMFKPVS